MKINWWIAGGVLFSFTFSAVVWWGLYVFLSNAVYALGVRLP